jgi:hypothetical protein
MTDTPATIRHISWRDLFPWLILLRTFRIAISPPMLAIATLAVILTPLGWAVAAWVFHPTPVRPAASTTLANPFAPGSYVEELNRTFAELRRQRQDALRQLGTLEGGRQPPPVAAPVPLPTAPTAVEPVVPWQQRVPRADNSLLADEMPLAPREYLPAAPSAILPSYLDFAEPLARFFQVGVSLRDAAFYLCGLLWMLLVWSLPGAFITRRAVVELATESPAAIYETGEFAIRRYGWYFLAPLYPLLGVALLTLPIALLGVLLQASLGFGSIVAGILWIFVAAAGVAAMWLLVGLMFGWPLMWPAISAERDGDAFEAFSRSYSYVYGRPLHYFFYFVVAALFGALCWAVVEIVTAIVIDFGFWALSWGSGGVNALRLRELALEYARTGTTPGASSAEAVGATLVGLVVALIQAVAIAFRYSYFFTAASAIYLLLRYNVDEKELDEVWLVKQPEAAKARVDVVTPRGPAAAGTPTSSG